MSKRFRSSRPSNKGRLLRPRSERSSQISLKGADSAQDVEALSSDDDSSEILAHSDSTPSVEPPAVADRASGVAATQQVASESAPSADDAEERESVAPISAPVVSAPAGTPRELSAAVAKQVEPPAPEPEPEPAALPPVEVAAPKAAPVEVAPAVAAKPAESSPTSQSGKKKKKKNKDRSSAVPSAPVTTPSAAAPSVVELSKSSSGKHGAMTESGRHAAMTESGRHRAQGAGLDDDPMAAEFFSVKPPPVVIDDHLEDDLNPPPPPMTPAMLERQRKMRKLVGGVVAVASLVVLFGIGRTMFSHSPADASPASQKTAPAPVVEEPAAPAATQEATVAKPAEPAPAPVETAAAEPSATADATASASAEASASASAAPAETATASSSLSADEIKALKKKAESAINRGDNKAAIDASIEALKADDTDALTYLYLGSAYMSIGKMKEAKEAFDTCANKAVGKPHYGECIQMGGRKAK